MNTTFLLIALVLANILSVLKLILEGKDKRRSNFEIFIGSNVAILLLFGYMPYAMSLKELTLPLKLIPFILLIVVNITYALGKIIKNKAFVVPEPTDEAEIAAEKEGITRLAIYNILIVMFGLLTVLLVNFGKTLSDFFI